MGQPCCLFLGGPRHPQALDFLISKMGVLQRLVQGNSEAASLVIFYYGFYQCALKGSFIFSSVQFSPSVMSDSL